VAGNALITDDGPHFCDLCETVVEDIDDLRRPCSEHRTPDPSARWSPSHPGSGLEPLDPRYPE
jgi:hypothetical protein